MPVGFDDEKVAKFKRLVGIRRTAQSSTRRMASAPIGGQLPAALVEQSCEGCVSIQDSMHPLETGIGVAQWDWRRRDDGNSMSRCSSPAPDQPALGRGWSRSRRTPRRSRVRWFPRSKRWVSSRRALALTTETTSFGSIAMFACDSATSGSGPKVLAVARRIQSILDAHLVPDVASHVPRIAGIEISRSHVRRRGDVRGDGFASRTTSRANDFTIDVRPASWPMLDPIEYRKARPSCSRRPTPGPRRAGVDRSRSGNLAFPQSRRRHRRSPCSVNRGGAVCATARLDHFQGRSTRRLRLVS